MNNNAPPMPPRPTENERYERLLRFFRRYRRVVIGLILLVLADTVVGLWLAPDLARSWPWQIAKLVVALGVVLGLSRPYVRQFMNRNDVV